MPNLPKTKVIQGAFGTGTVTQQVKVYGVPETVAKLKGIGSRAALELGHMNYRAAQIMFTTAVETVPVKTGNLKSGIKIAKVGAYNWAVTAASQDGTDPAGLGKNAKEYANFVEFGTRKMAGRFFMRAGFHRAAEYVAAETKAIAKRLELV